MKRGQHSSVTMHYVWRFFYNINNHPCTNIMTRYLPRCVSVVHDKQWFCSTGGNRLGWWKLITMKIKTAHRMYYNYNLLKYRDAKLVKFENNNNNVLLHS